MHHSGKSSNLTMNRMKKKITHKSDKFLSRVIFFDGKLNDKLSCCKKKTKKKTKAQTPPTGYVITSVSIYSDKSIPKHLFLGCYEAISETQRRAGRDEKKKKRGWWETGGCCSSSERSNQRKHGHAHCGHSAGTQCGTLRRQLSGALPRTSHPAVLSLSVSLPPNSTMRENLLPPSLPPPLPQPQTSPAAASPLLRFRTHSVTQPNMFIMTRQRRGHLIKEGGK